MARRAQYGRCCAPPLPVSRNCPLPAQDLFELGSEARMNTPSVAHGNWSWRAPEGAWTPELAARLAAIAGVTDRDNDPLAKPEEQLQEPAQD